MSVPSVAQGDIGHRDLELPLEQLLGGIIVVPVAVTSPKER